MLRDSHCYFSARRLKSGKYGTPTPKSGGTRPPVPLENYAYDHERSHIATRLVFLVVLFCRPTFSRTFSVVQWIRYCRLNFRPTLNHDVT